MLCVFKRKTDIEGIRDKNLNIQKFFNMYGVSKFNLTCKFENATYRLMIIHDAKKDILKVIK